MGVDLNALRDKYKEVTTKQNNQQNNEEFLKKFLRTKEGITTVRILPSKDNEKPFFAETKIHRIQSGQFTRNVHCRRVWSEPCPLCDFYKSLWQGEPTEKEKALARSIKPRPRYYMNVVDRELNEVKILSCGQKVFQIILGGMLGDEEDPDDNGLGDVTDLKEGYDFKIHMKQVKTGNDTWPNYDDSKFRPKTSPAGSAKEVAVYMESLHDIHSLVKLEDYEEVKKLTESLRAGKVIQQEVESQESNDEDSDDGSELDDNYLNQLRGKS